MIAVVGEEILGAVVVHDWNGTNAQLSIATVNEKWAGKEFIKTVFDFVFNCLKANHCTVYVREDNEKSLRMCKKLGFIEEGIMRQSLTDFDGNVYDGILLGMIRNECRWL